MIKAGVNVCRLNFSHGKTADHKKVIDTIREINAAGVGVLLVEQNARYALETASRGYVLQTGTIIASGPCAMLREDARVREAYLGRGAARVTA